MFGPSADELEELKKIFAEILDPAKRLHELLPSALLLRDVMERLTGFRPDGEGDIGEGSTRLESGLAISPALAAMCLRESFRTLVFIRGLHEAVIKVLGQDRPVHVLYAGCGPYALLALPLMAQFSPSKVRFTLLDIHQECIDQAMEIIAAFDFVGHVAAALCVDACQYQILEHDKPSVIVTETMAVCLRNEPQVSIARHLLAQAPEAKLIPESVSIEMAMVDFSKEYTFLPPNYDGEIPPPQRDRLYLGTVFELDAAAIMGWQGIADGFLPGGETIIPTDREPRYKPCLLTRIRVYGEHCLQDYDCSLTMPQRVAGWRSLPSGETLRFRYKLGVYPELIYEVLG